MKTYAEFVKDKINFKADFAIIIGSGLSSILDKVQIVKKISYQEIPRYPVSTVAGHTGELIFGTLSGKNILIFNGRVHFYEGYSMREITSSVYLAHATGANNIIITNAAGAVNTALNVGDIMLIRDHVNFIFADNPLREEKGNERFVDLINAYDKEYRAKVAEIARKKRINVKEGVYCAVAGPNYETMAELTLMNRLGIDAVGMSTVPEVIVARYLKMKVLGFSCITDSVFVDGKVTHEKVLDMASRCGKNISCLIEEFLKEI
ncbi:MAG: purine-nucleoside phosphorylase [Caldisericota bacterium]|nr:purine-nucleoside phosphorylase [Caldisericota bacterium]